MTDFRIYEGKNLGDIKKKASEEFGVEEKDLFFEILEEGSKAILGLVGGKKIKVKAMLKKNMPVANMAKSIIEKIISFFGPEYRLEVLDRNDETIINIIGPDSSILIGKDGGTLYALQHIVKKILFSDDSEGKKVFVDIGGYSQRRKEKLLRIAKSAVRRVIETNKPYALRDFTSFDRWLVHNELAEEHDIYTKSVGEGRDRKLLIIPNTLKDKEDEILKKWSSPFYNE